MTRPCPKCGAVKIATSIQRSFPLPSAWEALSLVDFTPTPGEERQLAQARRFAAHPHGWIVLQGPPGTGKTMMLAGILNAVKASGKSGVFLPARSIADLIYRALDPDAGLSLARIEEDLRYLDFVAIDELDKVDWSKTYLHDTFYNALNWRYEHLALTAVAFNDDARIAEPSPALYSRLRDGRWGDGRGSEFGTPNDDGIIRSTAADIRPYLKSSWQDAA